PTTFAVTGRCSNQLRYNSSTFLESALKILSLERIASHHTKIFIYFFKKIHPFAHIRRFSISESLFDTQ
ncbi:MAG: hypothetical protein MJ106_08155, partial [Lentisphaeria bacterium]|nr:hypothetical protein [Lentisphaeria bacterium]